VNTKRKLRTIGWGILTLISFFLVCLFIIGGFEAEELRREELSLISNGERTTATITSRKNYSDSGVDSYFIKYTFVVPSSKDTFTGYYNCLYTIPGGWEEGAHITIAYDLQNPTLNIPVFIDYKKDNPVPWFGMIFICIPLGVITFFLGKKTWNTWKLNKYKVH
jgi:hypothetical protein